MLNERAAAPVAEWQGLCLRTPLCLPKMAVLTGLGRGKAGLDEAGYKDHGPVSRLGLYAVLYICRDVLDLPCGDRRGLPFGLPVSVWNAPTPEYCGSRL